MSAAFYQDEVKFYVAVDCIILGFNNKELNVLLYKRSFEPMKGQWSLMGGFVKSGESVDEAASRVLTDCTGIEHLFMEQIGAYGDVSRDLGERVISVAYYSLVNMNDFSPEILENHNATWTKISELPDLIFDHNQMINDTLSVLKKKAASRPIGFNLLPEQFTLPQLQTLYEAIYQTLLDKRNFRKKLNAMDILEKLDIKEFRKSRHTNGMVSVFARGKLQKTLLSTLNWKGYDFLEVVPDFTSQVCPVCQNLDPKNREHKTFFCTCCGYEDDADHVGSLNIRTRATDQEILDLCQKYQYKHKELQRAMKIVYAGRTPVAAVGTTDMHSLTQEHQQGKKNKLFQFISVDSPSLDTKAYCMEGESEGFVQMSRMLTAAMKSNAEALASEQRMSCRISVSRMTPYHLGALMYFFFLTIAYEGSLLQINAFDQPGVEAYKKILHQYLRSFLQ